MKYLKMLVMLMTISGASVAYADVNNPELIDYELRSAFIPQGFDSNDKVQFAVSGSLPSTCYRTGPLTIKIDKENKTIKVRQQVYKYDTICLYMIVPFQKTIEVGILPKGDYSIVSASGATIGKLPVKNALSPAADDFLYAPVSDVRVRLEDDGARYATVEGVFSNACLKLKELRVLQDGNRVITILPIAEMSMPNCMTAGFPFKQSVRLPDLANGRYLLNTRSLNGEAVFKFFDVE